MTKANLGVKLQYSSIPSEVDLLLFVWEIHNIAASPSPPSYAPINSKLQHPPRARA